MLQILYPDSIREVLPANAAEGNGCQVRTWDESHAMGISSSLCCYGETTYYGIAIRSTKVSAPAGTFKLMPFMFFALKGPLDISGGSGLLVRRNDFVGLNVVGGPIESKGRLRYIDGCSDSLLIGPPRVGDPCLNHLHFPAGTKQTMHTHPTLRVGAIVRGRGRCVEAIEGGGTKETELKPGMFWLLPSGSPHCFFTDDSTMDVVAWHPDSNVGPTDDRHPMITRTLVNGVPASELAAIKTTREQLEKQ